jgi:hypothetical protein
MCRCTNTGETGTVLILDSRQAPHVNMRFGSSPRTDDGFIGTPQRLCRSTVPISVCIITTVRWISRTTSPVRTVHARYVERFFPISHTGGLALEWLQRVDLHCVDRRNPAYSLSHQRVSVECTARGKGTLRCLMPKHNYGQPCVGSVPRYFFSFVLF